MTPIQYSKGQPIINGVPWEYAKTPEGATVGSCLWAVSPLERAAIAASGTIRLTVSSADVCGGGGLVYQLEVGEEVIPLECTNWYQHGKS
jgi:hypothetical protein